MERARRSRTAKWRSTCRNTTRDFGSRRAIAQQMRRIALIMRRYLPEGAADVHSIVITFGSGHETTREEVKLP
jgi:hypothetical protein